MLNKIRHAEIDAFGRILLALVISIIFHVIVLLESGVLFGSSYDRSPVQLQVKLNGAAVDAAEKKMASDSLRPSESPPVLQKTPEPAVKSPDTKVRAAPIKKKAASSDHSEAQPSSPVPQPAASSDQDTASRKSALPANQPSGIPIKVGAAHVRRVDIKFDILAGPDQRRVGSGRHRYLSENGELFSVSMTTEASGIDGEHTGEQGFVEVSGRIDRQGLNSLFIEAKGSESGRLLSLKDTSSWLSSLPGNYRKSSIPDGLLDRQSLLYQFMINPPALGGGRVWLSDGVTNGVFRYRLATFEEQPITALGGVRAIKVELASTDSTELVELWLVPDMHYLPVKVRHVDGKGNSTEQIITSLNFSE